MKIKKAGAFKTRSFTWDTKAVKEDGLFSGYGSVFGVVDAYNEVVARGAFVESLAALKSADRTLPVLWQHDTRLPIGNWTGLAEDDHGLKGDGALWLDDAPEARRALRGMQTRSITGLSIGYYVEESSYNEETRLRTLTKLELVEISIVTVPANDDARVDAIKSKLAHGGLPTLPEFEQLLREAGFSKSQATVVASRGLKHLLQRSESASDTASLTQALAGFSLPKF